MGALEKSMQFIIKDVRKNNYRNETERTVAQYMLSNYSNWSKIYKNQIAVEAAIKRVKQSELLLTAEKMKKYKASEEYRRAFSLLSECDREEFILTARICNHEELPHVFS